MFNKILEAAIKAQWIVDEYDRDTESMHIYLDELILEVLREEGYDELADIFDAQDLWYT